MICINTSIFALIDRSIHFMLLLELVLRNDRPVLKLRTDSSPPKSNVTTDARFSSVDLIDRIDFTSDRLDAIDIDATLLLRLIRLR